jgi:hypothetical protein
MVSGASSSSSSWFSSPTHAASPATVLSMMNVALRPEGSAAEDGRYAGNDPRPHLHLHHQHHQHHRNHSNDDKHRDVGGSCKKKKDGGSTAALPASERLRSQAPRLLRQIDGSDLFLRMKRIQIRPMHADGAEASADVAPATTAAAASSSSSSIELARVYPAFDKDEVVVGPLLGVGGFCSVYQVETFCLKDGEEKKASSSRHEVGIPMQAQQQQVNATSNDQHHDDHHEDDDHHQQRDDDSHGERFWSTAGGRAKRGGGGGGGGASVASTLSSCGSLSPSSSLHGHPTVNGDAAAAQSRPPRRVRMDPRHVMQQRARRRQVRQKEGEATNQNQNQNQHPHQPSANLTDARYAIKRLHWDTLNDFERVRGSIDLAMEAKYLSALSHPNIGTCHGMIVDIRYRWFDCRWRNS